MNIIIDTKQLSEDTIKQCIDLVQITQKHEKVIKYILRTQDDKNQK